MLAVRTTGALGCCTYMTSRSDSSSQLMTSCDRQCCTSTVLAVVTKISGVVILIPSQATSQLHAGVELAFWASGNHLLTSRMLLYHLVVVCSRRAQDPCDPTGLELSLSHN